MPPAEQGGTLGSHPGGTPVPRLIFENCAREHCTFFEWADNRFSTGMCERFNPSIISTPHIRCTKFPGRIQRRLTRPGGIHGVNGQTTQAVAVCHAPGHGQCKAPECAFRSCEKRRSPGPRSAAHGMGGARPHGISGPAHSLGRMLVPPRDALSPRDPGPATRLAPAPREQCPGRQETRFPLRA